VLKKNSDFLYQFLLKQELTNKNMNTIQSDLSGQILKAYYIVYSRLGYGFSENVYENAMIIEMVKQGLYCTLQRPLNVFYDEVNVGKCFAEIIVNEQIILEVKCRESINTQDEEQLLNYLKATEIEIGMLLNFGKEPQYRSRFLMNNLKQMIRQPTSSSSRELSS
jgi:GxxExxY protein